MVINKSGIITENDDNLENNVTMNSSPKAETSKVERLDLDTESKINLSEAVNHQFDQQYNFTNESFYSIERQENEQPNSLNTKSYGIDQQESPIFEQENEQQNNLNNISYSTDQQENLELEQKNKQPNDLSNSNAQDEEKQTVETNCLALTVRKNYNFSIAKNTVFKTIRMSIKVAISTFVLNVLKLFF